MLERGSEARDRLILGLRKSFLSENPLQKPANKQPQ